MSCLLLLLLATKTTLCQQNLLSLQKALVMTQHICCVSKKCADSPKIHDTLCPDADSMWTLTSIWFLSGRTLRPLWTCAYDSANKYATYFGRRRPTVYRMWTLASICFFRKQQQRATRPLCLHHWFDAVLVCMNSDLTASAHNVIFATVYDRTLNSTVMLKQLTQLWCSNLQTRQYPQSTSPYPLFFWNLKITIMVWRHVSIFTHFLWRSSCFPR